MQKNQRKREEKLKKDQKQFNQNKRDLKKLGKEKQKGFLTTIFDYFKLEDKRYTIEDSIPYKRMYEDGICMISVSHLL